MTILFTSFKRTDKVSEGTTDLEMKILTEWRQCLDIGTEEDSIHQLDRAAQVTIFRLRTGHCQLLFHIHRLNIFHSDECPCGTGPQPPTTSCSPAPPSMLWGARHGPVWWMPTGSFGDRLTHYSRLWTLPYSPDWRASLARNAEEEEEEDWLHFFCMSNKLIYVISCVHLDSQSATHHAQTRMFNIMHYLFNKILSHLLRLKAPLISTIVYHFQWPWPRLCNESVVNWHEGAQTFVMVDLWRRWLHTSQAGMVNVDHSSICCSCLKWIWNKCIMNIIQHWHYLHLSNNSWGIHRW